MGCRKSAPGTSLSPPNIDSKSTKDRQANDHQNSPREVCRIEKADSESRKHKVEDVVGRGNPAVCLTGGDQSLVEMLAMRLVEPLAAPPAEQEGCGSVEQEGSEDQQDDQEWHGLDSAVGYHHRRRGQGIADKEAADVSHKDSRRWKVVAQEPQTGGGQHEQTSSRQVVTGETADEGEGQAVDGTGPTSQSIDTIHKIEEIAEPGQPENRQRRPGKASPAQIEPADEWQIQKEEGDATPDRDERRHQLPQILGQRADTVNIVDQSDRGYYEVTSEGKTRSKEAIPRTLHFDPTEWKHHPEQGEQEHKRSDHTQATGSRSWCGMGAALIWYIDRSQPSPFRGIDQPSGDQVGDDGREDKHYHAKHNETYLTGYAGNPTSTGTSRLGATQGSL